MTDNTHTRSRSGAVASGRDSGGRQNHSSPIPALPSSSSSHINPFHNTNFGHYPRSPSNDLQRPSSNNSSNTAPVPYNSSTQLQQSRQPLATLRPGQGSGAVTRMRSESNPPPPLHRDPSLSASDSPFPQRRAFRESSSASAGSTANGTQALVGTYSRSVLADTGDKDRASPGPSTGTFRNVEKFSPGIATGTGTRARAITSSGSSAMERRNMFSGAISSVAEWPPYSTPVAREPSSGGTPSYGSSLHPGTKSPSPAPRRHSKSITIPPVYSSHVASTNPVPTTTSSASNAMFSPPPTPRYSTKPTPASSAQLTMSAASSGIVAPATATKEKSTAQSNSPLPVASAVDLAGKRLREQQLQDRFKAAQIFIERTVAQPLPSSDLHESLKDGVILCRLANRLRPGTVEQISLKNLPFVKMENISNFLNAARQLGVQSSDLFQTVDLYEGKDMNQVVSTILTLERVVGGVVRMVPKDRQPGSSPSLTTGSTSQIPKTGINDAPAVTRVRSKTAHAPNKVSATPSIRPSSSSYYAAQVRKLEEDSIRFAAGYNRSEETAFKSKDPRHQSTPAISRSTPTPTWEKPPRIPSVNGIDAGVDNINFGGDNFDSSHLEALNRQEQRDLVFGAGSSLTLEQSASILKSTSGPYLSVDGKASALDKSRRRMKSISLDPQAANAVMGSPNYRDGLASPGSPGVLTQSVSYNAISNLGGPGIIGANTQLANLKQHSRYPSDRTVDGNNRSVLGSLTSSRSTTPVQGIRKSANGIEPLREKLELWENDVPVATYQLGNCIGRGQFGAVYRALNLGSGQMVAVKRIKIDGLKDDERDMLMQEVDLLKSLAHPSIVKYEGFIKTEGYLNIILEFVENGSLLTTLKSFGTFPEKLVVAYVVKILEGLVYLHGKEVVHCDLKAANILTTKNGNVKLSDFGVSLNLKVKESDFGAVAGTPNWMAPEVIELKGASPASDIWSLGCTIIEMLTGRPPYADLLAMTTLFRIVEDERPPLPNNLSVDLLDFLCQCFQKDPILRPSAGDLGRHAWIKRNFASKHELKPMDSLPYMKRKLMEPKEKTLMATTMEENTVSAAKRASTPLGLSSVPPPAASATAMPPTSGRSTRRGSIDSASGSYASSTVPTPTHFAEKHQEMKSSKTENQHQFVKSSFAKPVECRLCHDYVKKQAVICQDCSMVFHRACQFYVGNTCFPSPHLSYFQTPTPAQSVPNLKVVANGNPKRTSRPNSRASQSNLDDRSRSVTPLQGVSSRPCPTPPLSAYAKREAMTISENREHQRRAAVSPPPLPSSSRRDLPSDDYSHHMEQHSQNHGSRPSSRQSDSPTSPTLSGLRNFIAGPRRFSFGAKKNGAQNQTVSHPLPTPPTSYTAPSTPTYGMNVRRQSVTPDSSKGHHAGHSNSQQMQRQAPVTPPKPLPAPILMNDNGGSGGRAYRGREYIPGGPLDPFTGDHEGISSKYGRSHQRQFSGSIFSTSAPPVHVDFMGRGAGRDGRRSAASTKYGGVEDEDANYHERVHDEMGSEEDDDDDAGHEDIDHMEEEDLEALLVPSIARRTPRSSIDAGNPVIVTNSVGSGHHRAKSQSFGQALSYHQQQQPQNRYEKDAASRSPGAISFGASPTQQVSSHPSSGLQQEHQTQQQQQQQFVSRSGRTAPLNNGYNSSGSSSAALTSSYSSQSNNSSSTSSLGSTVATLLEEEERMLKEIRLHQNQYQQQYQHQRNSSSAGKSGMLNIPSAYNQATSPPQSHHVDIRTMFSRFSDSPNNDLNSNSNSNINGQKEKGSSVFSRMSVQDKKEPPTKPAANPARHQIQTQQQYSLHPLNGVRSIHPLQQQQQQQYLSSEGSGNPKTEFSQGYERISHYQHGEYGTRTGYTNSTTSNNSDGNAAWRASSPGGIGYSGYSGVPSASTTLGSSSNNTTTTAGTTTTGIASVSALKRGGKVMRRSMGAALEKERWD